MNYCPTDFFEGTLILLQFDHSVSLNVFDLYFSAVLNNLEHDRPWIKMIANESNLNRTLDRAHSS